MKYSKEIVKEICKHTKEGSNYEDAAALAGIGESTFYEWKQKKPGVFGGYKSAELTARASSALKGHPWCEACMVIWL